MIGGPIAPFTAAFCVGLVSSARELPPSAGNFRCRILLGQFSSSVSKEHIACTIERIIKLVSPVKYQELGISFQNFRTKCLCFTIVIFPFPTSSLDCCWWRCISTLFWWNLGNTKTANNAKVLFQQCNKTNSRSFIFGHIALAFLTCCCNILCQKFIPCLEECDGTGIYLLFLQFRCFIVQLCAGIFMSPFHHCAI